MEPDQQFQASGADMRNYRSGGCEVSERLSYATGEKSIGYPRKVYRVFPESL